MYKIALIGYGYWGANLLRNLVESIYVSSIFLHDSNNERLLLAKKIYPSIEITNEILEILYNDEIDIVIIATPTSTHYHLAKIALKHHKHVLVEKPICTSSKEVEELYQLAAIENKILFIDLTFLYNGAVEYIEDFINKNNIGKIKYIDSTRVNLGIYQEDTNVLWDLAPHDISIVQMLLKNSPIRVRAIGNPKKSIQEIDFIYIFLYYPDNLIVHINCSWASPTKIRQMIIGGEKKMIIYDEVEPSQKIKIYDYSTTIKHRDSTLIDYRLGDISIPKFSTIEPLQKMLNTFFNCIESNEYSFYSPHDAIKMIRIIECLERSLLSNGDIIEL